ncbi:hypothetical protein CEXT_544831 [Caerostris extrusa]|uniref:Uncharacterized protein n=1 Tax=Caerostris extrusa TaxID=172846 RepID=A0AAV4YGC6_CAEEX|nr:hypothetical protein CEXT_544831 [Caerostris extrusa]
MKKLQQNPSSKPFIVLRTPRIMAVNSGCPSDNDALWMMQPTKISGRGISRLDKLGCDGKMLSVLFSDLVKMRNESLTTFSQ